MGIHRMVITGGIIVGSLMLAGCGATPVAAPSTNHSISTPSRIGHSSAKVPSSSSSNIGPSNHGLSLSTGTSSAATAVASGTPKASATSTVTITNPPLSQIQAKINAGQIYGVPDAQPGVPGQVVLMTAKASVATLPTTLNHRPPQHFQVYAILTNPENQLGVTPWINRLSHEIHWMRKGTGIAIPVTVK